MHCEQSYTVAFQKVVRRHFQARWASLQFSAVKLPQDSVYQKLLKSVHFSPSYSNIKEAAFFEIVYKGWPKKVNHYQIIKIVLSREVCQ